MKVAFIFGTRPEIIKLSPVIHKCMDDGDDFITVHTGQHYSHSMSRLFIEELELPEPDYDLGVRSKAPYKQGDHTGRMMIKLEEIILKEMPDVVLVHGDTNTTLAGALVTSKIATTRSFTGFDIKLGHVEAGLRSYDRTMPEDLNRVIADHLSDYLFAPTKNARDTAMGEGIPGKKISVTGNTIVDALYRGLETSKKRPDFLAKNRIQENGYMLLTLHRQENVDNEKRLKDIMEGVGRSARENEMPVIFPAHPRTLKMFEKFGLRPDKAIRVIEPCGFLDFLQLESKAKLIFTDSGGVQEEACALHVPCVTLRTTTERPETVAVGANVIAGVKDGDIFKAACCMAVKKRKWRNPFGDGKAANAIMNRLKKDFKI